MSINQDTILQEIIAEKLSLLPEQKGESNPAMLDSLDQMNLSAINHSYRDIPADTLGEKIIKPFKRLMRRFTFWFVEPCVLQQNEYNSANNRFSLEAQQEIQTLHSEIQEIRKQNTEMQMLSAKMSIQLTDMQKRLQQAEERQTDQHESDRQKIKALQQAYQQSEGKLSDQNIMMQSLRKQIQKLEKLSYLSDPAMLKQNETDEFRVSFSQSGEDDIIRYIFDVLNIHPGKCRYLDLGANHAVHLSNTYGFYREGARGVLVDANPVLAQELSERRPGDIVINKCLSDQSGKQIKFYILNGDGLSTPDEAAAKHAIEENPALSIEKIIMTETITINDIMNQYFPDKAPEIMNIDLESMEMTILHMINFKKHRPLIIICEMISYRNSLTIGEKNPEILQFMHSVGYEEFAFTGINSVFIDKMAKELKHK